MKKSWLINILLVCGMLCMSCQDDLWSEMALSEGTPAGTGMTKAAIPMYEGDNTALRLMKDGTWLATERVPLTGVGRVLGNLTNGLVGVVGSTNNLGNIVDTDLTNVANLGGVAKVEALYGQILSVKDLYRTYRGGQKAGFVCRPSKGSALELNVLKQMTLTLYNDGKLVQTFDVSTDGKVLGLDLINVNTSDGEPQHMVSVTVPEGKNFDEIALGIAGVDASVIAALEVYYAFVGETPMRTTVKKTSGAYNDAFIYDKAFENWSNMIASDHLVDDNPDNGPVIEVVSGLLNPFKGGERVTVSFAEDIPANTEVGFVFSGGNLLNLGLGRTISLETYDAQGKVVEEYKTGNVLGVSLIGGGKAANSFVAQKPFRMIYMRILGIALDLGATQYHYAYTRAQTKEDITSNFNFPAHLTTQYTSCRLLKPAKGTLTVVPTSPGTATYNSEKQRITGLTEVGNYTFKLIYECDGHRFTQDLTITREIDSADTAPSCNTLITAETNGATMPPAGEGNILCVICDNAKNWDYLLDADVNTCMVHYGGLQLGTNTNVVTVANIKNLDAGITQKKYRAGFIVEMSNEFLTLNALNYLYVELFNGPDKIETKVSGSRPTIDLGLINGNQGKLRIGVEVPAGQVFDRITLRYAGVLGLNLNNLRLYGVFYEPADLVCARSGATEACMEPMSPANYNLQVDYKHTRLNGGVQLINGMYSMDNFIDGDNETFVTMPMALDVASDNKLSASFNTLPANQTIGLVLQNIGGVGDVNVLEHLSFKVFQDDVELESMVENQGLADVSLISHEDKMFMEFAPTQPYNRLELKVIKTIGALNQLQVFGIYTREDLNGDGIPDCNPVPDDSEQPARPSQSIYHLCFEPLVNWNIKVSGGKAGDQYVLTFRKYEYEDFSTAPHTELNPLTLTYDGSGFIRIPLNQIPLVDSAQTPVGVYTVSFAKNGEKNSYYTVILYIHPKQTTWSGATPVAGSEHGWNHWKNWVEGAPWGYTDVVIPGGCTHYPSLQSSEDNFCARIQFEANAFGQVGEVAHTEYLTYDAAWVDAALQQGTYYLLAAPLKDVYTGDVFADARTTFPATVPGQAADYPTAWQLYNKDKAPLAADFRFTPQVFQHTFGGPISNVSDSGMEQLQPGHKNWTAAFNLVAEPYELGRAFLVQMGKAGAAETTYRMRWPKQYSEYEYYRVDDKQPIQPNRKETLSRTHVGRFIGENEQNKVVFPLRMERINERPGDLFLFGNPFMSSLSVEKFLEVNVAVGQVWVLRNGTYEIYERDQAVGRKIRPMEGFFVKLRSPYAERNRYHYYVHLLSMMQD